MNNANTMVNFDTAAGISTESGSGASVLLRGMAALTPAIETSSTATPFLGAISPTLSTAVAEIISQLPVAQGTGPSLASLQPFTAIDSAKNECLKRMTGLSSAQDAAKGLSHADLGRWETRMLLYDPTDKESVRATE